MSDLPGQWCIATDGFYNPGGNFTGLEYHQKLNLLLITSKDRGVYVYDSTSATLLKKTDLAAGRLENVVCQYMTDIDGLLISDGEHITIRKDLNGMYLLDTALNGKVKEDSGFDTIRLEIPLADAETLVNGVVSFADMLKVDQMDDIIDRLKLLIQSAQKECEDNQKRAKWSTVTIEYSQSALLYVFQHIMCQLKEKTSDAPLALPIASALTERCAYYAVDFNINSPVSLDRGLMYSEASRLASFENWPHMGYQWAKPETMSRAGFYHEPTSSNEDRCMCFTCNVCLVCWERTDEPWSEHERHQPNCPFIKGLPTQNVPLEVYYASQPAIKSNHTLLSTTKSDKEIYLAALQEDQATVKIYVIGRQLELSRELLITAHTSISDFSDSIPMLESSALGEDNLSMFRVTAMALLSLDDEQSGLILAAASLSNQIIQLSTYGTGYISSTIGKVDLDPSVAATFSSPEQLAEAIYLEQRYLVSEPTGDKPAQKGVVVPCVAKISQSITLPNMFCYPGYTISLVEQSLDKEALLVYITMLDLDMCPEGVDAGALLLYKVQARGGMPIVSPHPTAVNVIAKVDDSIVHIHQLSSDFSSTRETEFGVDKDESHILVTRRSGAISLMSVKQLQEIVSYTSDTHKFLHSVYCSGIDRVCATTRDGSLVTLQVNPVMSSFGLISADMLDSAALNKSKKHIDQLFKEPLTVKNLKSLAELTECENLSGRFTATLPPCWNEVQQDQHQRKHPQHLQQSLSATSASGEGQASNVTRTWKLQPEGDTALREHVIELCLPKITTVGHVDVRFTFNLQNKARELPDIKVALLCYKMENSKPSGKAPLKFSRQAEDSPFLTQSFLDRHNMQLLSAPVSLASGMDVSGISGIVTLTAPALLNIRPRSLIVCLKAVDDTKAKKSQGDSATSSSVMPQHLETLLFPRANARGSSSQRSNGSPASSRQSAVSYSRQGINIIDELSISVRKTKQTQCASDRLTRLAMLDNAELHKALVKVAYTGQLLTDEKSPLLATEQNRMSSMRILGWIASLQMNDVSRRKYEETILSVVEDNLRELVERCLVRGTRSSSHSLNRLLTASTELSRRLGGEESVVRFSQRLLEALLDNISKLKEAQSAGAVSAYFVLLGRVQCLDHSVVSRVMCSLLLSLSQLYSESYTDADMRRLSSYGITSAPYDAEMFDVGLPLFVSKNLVFPPDPAFNTMSAAQQKQHQQRKEELYQSPMVDLTHDTSQGLTPHEQLDLRMPGLLEVEPLQFSINSYSEYIHVTHGNNPNVTPVFYGSGSTNAPDPSSLTHGLPINIPQTAGSIKAKIASLMNTHKAHTSKVDSMINKIQKEGLEAMKKLEDTFMKSFSQGAGTSSSAVNYPEMPPGLPLSDAMMTPFGMHMVPDASPSGSSKATGSASQTTGQQLGKQLSDQQQAAMMNAAAPYPGIQAILQPPNEFTLIAGRMSSGSARRFIVLDFGQPVRLTDIVIPASSDVTSLAIDVWVEGELMDSQRLVICTDILTKCLVLSDIQPACVCRFLKITYAPRIGGAAQTYRIPLGVFYGHAYVFPWETTANVMALRSPEVVWRQVGVYMAAVEDIKCCYKLACVRLQQLMLSAEGQSVDRNQEGHALTTPIQQALDECERLQQQLNLASSAIRRLRSVLPAAHETDSNLAPSAACRDKLRYLIEASLGVIISRPVGAALCPQLYHTLTSNVAKQLFTNLCIHGNRRMQILTGNLLVQVCHGEPWYGRMYELILSEMYSSTYKASFAKLRVFGLLVSMAQRSLSTGQRASHRVCGNVLKLLSSHLSPLTSNTSSSGYIDMELVSWLLLFLAKLTDCNFDVEDPILLNRWEFMSDDRSISKRKVYHRFSCRQKVRQERTQVAMRHRFNTSSSSRQSKHASPASKQKDRMMMKKQMMMRNEREMMRMRRFDMMDHYPDPRIRRRMAMMMMGDPDMSMMSGGGSSPAYVRKVAVILKKSAVLPAVRGLMSLILRANVSCHTDMFILTCKVLSRLSTSARPSLKLGDLATADQLKKLIYNITHCKYNSKTRSWAGDWGKHAVICLLEDLVDGERANLDTYDNAPDPEDAPEDGAPGTSSGRSEGAGESSAYIEMMGEVGRPMFPPGPGGPRSLDMLKMMRRDEMMVEDLMDLDMEMDMMYGPEMEEEIMDRIAFGHPGGFPPDMLMSGPRPPQNMSEGPPTMNQIQSPISSAIDSRLKYCCDASAELRLQLWLSDELSNQHKSLSHQGPLTQRASTITDSPTRLPTRGADAAAAAVVEESASTQNGNEAVTTEELLGQTFSSIIISERGDVDFESLLSLYLEISEEYRDDTKEDFDPALRPSIPLAPLAIETLVQCIASGQNLNTKGWTQLLRVLTLLLNSNLNDEDRVFALRLCGSDTLHLLVSRFLRCADVVGPLAIKAFEDLLTRIQMVYQTANADLNALTDMLISTLTRTLTDSYDRRTIDGALDAQCSLIDFIFKTSSKPVVTPNVLSLFECTGFLAKKLIDEQDTIVPLLDDESELDVTSCFQTASKTSANADDDCGPQSTVPTENRLLVSLLNLLSHLLKQSVPVLPPPGAQPPETDSSKLSRGSSDQLDIEQMDTSDSTSQQTDEQKRTEGDFVTLTSTRNKCLHLMEVDVAATLADAVLGNRPLVAMLIQCLAACRTSSLISRPMSKTPVTIGDGVFRLLTQLFRTSTNYYQMLELLQEHLSSSRVVDLSDPLRLLIMLTLNCEHTISRFLELDGINCIARRFVESYSASPDSSGGMISTVLQHLTTTYSVRTPPPSTITMSHLTMSTSGHESLMNFAPLGNVYSGNASVGPMYSLIQAIQTHRRARTAPWSHKFTAEQPWVDISIQLPCAVLVKEIQIHPYINSIHSAAPSLVSVELSHDGLPTLPARRPVVTSGLSCIKIRLLEAEILSCVTIRLHKPRDSSSIGLTQLCVLGYPGLCEPGALPQRANTSLGWLQILYHCIDHTPAVSSQVLTAVQDQSQLLHTCCSLVMSDLSATVTAQLEKVIIELAVTSIDISKTVIDILLRQHHQDLVLLRFESMASDATAEILYHICLRRDSYAPLRVTHLLRWLVDCAEFTISQGALRASSETPANFTQDPGLIRPAKLHIQCVAATLYHSAQLNSFDVASLFSPEVFNHLFCWSILLSADIGMKRAVDGVIAAMCHIDLSYFQTLLQKFFVTPLAASNQTEILQASVSDDAKDDVQQEMLTDERKEHCRFVHSLIMNADHLSLLACAAQSPACARALIDSTLPRVLSQALAEFCLKELQRGTQPAPPSSASLHANSVTVNWKTLSTTLAFLKQCASASPLLKDWMGDLDGQLFWAPLLELFSSNGTSLLNEPPVEAAIVTFFKTITLNHATNQLAFSKVMCNLLRVLASMPNCVAGASLSSFMKNLLLQTMLEDEKLYVTISSLGVNYRFNNNSSSCCSWTNSCAGPAHLGVGVGHSTHTMLVPMYTTMDELAETVSKQDPRKTGPSGGRNKPRRSPSALPLNDPEQFAGPGYPGFPYEHEDVMYASASGMSAKSKRDKASSKASTRSSSQTDLGKAMRGAMRKVQFVQSNISDEPLDGTVTVAQLLASLLQKGLPAGTERIDLQIFKGPTQEQTVTCAPDSQTSSTLKVFTGLGGLALLAEHLPLLYPEITQPNRPSTNQQQSTALSDQDYEFVTQVKGISLGGMQYETVTVGGDKKDQPKKTATGPTTIPPHSLVAFGLFLRLPGYAEMLIKQRLSAKCLLRLVLGVRDDGEGVPILASPIAHALPTLPFTNLKLLYESSPLTTDDGLMLRRSSMDVGALHLVLACLSALSHHPRRKAAERGSEHDQLTQAAILMAHQVIGAKKPKVTSATHAVSKKDEQTGQTFWAKGTGFGTGSTSTQWDLQQLLLKQQSEEEHVTCMLDIISAMVDPEDKLVLDSHTPLPPHLYNRLSESCLLPAIASYLRNDSVLDMSRHVPLYQSVYRTLRALASCQELVPLLQETVSKSDSSTLEALSASMAKCVATYKNRLRPTTSQTPSRPPADKNAASAAQEEEDQANSLNELAVVLADTEATLSRAIQTAKERRTTSSPGKPASTSSANHTPPKVAQTYESVMKDLQFDAHKLIEGADGACSMKFLCHHHYEMSVRQGTGASSASNARTRRLAQEAVTLSTSLPLSSSSSVFVRCDEERMDVMKVLITGPSDTPYMNGCFEFDVFFPNDYPTSPPLINLQTTGNHKVRFNPNLYNDGKVCLSILNTWHGRPEEKWNAQTSSFLQVLVSIQSLILVSEPYFNEPGYERSRGTPAGTANCREYDSNIRQATVKYAMLEMLKHPSDCFKEIVEKHFWMKRKEIKEQIELWLADQELSHDSRTGAKAKSHQTISHNTMLLKKHYQQLLAELQKMKLPEGMSSSSLSDWTSTPVTVDMEVSSGSSVKSPNPISQPLPTGFFGSGPLDMEHQHDLAMEAMAKMQAAMIASGSASPGYPMPDGLDVLGEMVMDNDWPGVQDISSNSSEMMDTGEDIVLSPPEHSSVDYDDPSIVDYELPYDGTDPVNVAQSSSFDADEQTDQSGMFL